MDQIKEKKKEKKGKRNPMAVIEINGSLFDENSIQLLKIKPEQWTIYGEWYHLLKWLVTAASTEINNDRLIVCDVDGIDLNFVRA